MRLNELRDIKGAHKAPRRLGRGRGSGKGKTGGRGQKGQKSRSGVSLLGFEGGQMPLYRRTPKRGFHNQSGKTYELVNVGRLQQAIDGKRLDIAKTIDVLAMADAGLISGNRDGVRLLGMGELSTKVTIEVTGASKSAIAEVERFGGKVILPKPTKTILEARTKSAKLHEKKSSANASNVAVQDVANVDDEAPE